MDKWEIERKLNDKVEKWEFHSLQTEIRGLKDHIFELETKINVLESASYNRYQMLERLLNMLAEREDFADMQSEIYDLKYSL